MDTVGQCGVAGVETRLEEGAVGRLRGLNCGYCGAMKGI